MYTTFIRSENICPPPLLTTQGLSITTIDYNQKNCETDTLIEEVYLRKPKVKRGNKKRTLEVDTYSYRRHF